MSNQLIEKIEEKRIKMNVSKSELSRMAGITYRQYTNLINGAETTVSTIEKLMKALKIKKLTISL